MKLENGKAEEILANFLEEALKEADIDGKTINEANLDRMVKARILALAFFDGVEDVEFEFIPVSRMRQATTTNIICPQIEFDRANDGSCEAASILQELIGLVDGFEVSAITGRQVLIQFSINNIWEE